MIGYDVGYYGNYLPPVNSFCLEVKLNQTKRATSIDETGAAVLQDNGVDWEREIRALEAEACRVIIACDFDSLAGMFSEQLVVNNPLNQVVGKQQVLELMRSGRVRHTSLESSIEAIQRSGDVVVVMGREAVAEPDGKRYGRRYTNIWRREGNAWKLLARHANIITS